MPSSGWSPIGVLLAKIGLGWKSLPGQLLWIIWPYFSTPFYIENIINLFFKTSYLNNVVNCIKPSPLVSIPWTGNSLVLFFPERQQ
jgi:hypothetical protein